MRSEFSVQRPRTSAAPNAVPPHSQQTTYASAPGSAFAKSLYASQRPTALPEGNFANNN